MERYVPPFTVTIQMMKQVAEIAEKIGKISNYHSFETKPHLRRNNRIEERVTRLEKRVAMLEMKDGAFG